MTDPRDIARRYLVVAAEELPPGSHGDTHLVVLSWNARLEEWIHGQGICGQITRQGELADGSTVTCTGCLSRRADYERWLSPDYQPGQDASTEKRLRAELLLANQHANRADADRADAEAALLEARASRQRLNAQLARIHAEAAADRAALDAVRRLSHLTLGAPSASVRAQRQARDTLAAIESVTAGQATPGDDAWGTVWLEGNWQWLTSRMTTPAREHAADAVARWSARLAADDNEPDRGEPDDLRWWREN